MDDIKLQSLIAQLGSRAIRADINTEAPHSSGTLAVAVESPATARSASRAASA